MALALVDIQGQRLQRTRLGSSAGSTGRELLCIVDLLLGQWGHISFVFELMLHSAVAASILACIINLIIWKRKGNSGEPEADGNVHQQAKIVTANRDAGQ